MRHDPREYLTLIRNLPTDQVHAIAERVEGALEGERFVTVEGVFDALLPALPDGVRAAMLADLDVIEREPDVLGAIATHFDWPGDVYGGERVRSAEEAARDHLWAAEVRRRAEMALN